MVYSIVEVEIILSFKALALRHLTHENHRHTYEHLTLEPVHDGVETETPYQPDYRFSQFR